MIRESKIKELVYDKVVTVIEKELTRFGFKYQKSKKYFIRQENIFNHIVSVGTPYSPISYDENTDTLHLTFNVSSQLEIPGYEQWHFDKLGEKSHFSLVFEGGTSQVELSYDDLKTEDFYEPTASQKFKRSVTLSLAGNNNKDLIPLSELLEIKIPMIVDNLASRSDILKIHESREYPFQHMTLLVFGGYTDLANEQFVKYH